MSKFFSVEGRVAVVTGAAQGIGLAIAERLTEAGARVVLSDVSGGEKEAERLGALFFKADVSNQGQVENLMEFAERELGPIGIVVNNAGIHRNYDPIIESNPVDWEMCQKVNLLGVVHSIKAAVPRMCDGGAIINIASLAASVGTAGLGSYAASKAGIVAITKTAAIELGPRRIRVNAICPGSVATPMALAEGGEALLEVEKIAVPLQRICDPAEIASLVHFLASDDCGHLNGQAINVCGGMSAGLSLGLWEHLAG